MEIKLKYDKNIYKNLEDIYAKAKKMKKKWESAEKTAKTMNKKIKTKEKRSKDEAKEIHDKKWYEKFFWFFTSKGKLAIGGRNKEQNDIIFKEHFESNDLFFHADIIGGSAVILKNGKKAEEDELIETAQFAACYSKAWKEGFSRMSSYCVEYEGVKKNYKGKKAEPGSFFIIGERRWFKNMTMKIRIGIKDNSVFAVPEFSKLIFDKEVDVKPGRVKKEVIAKEIAKFLKVSTEKILNILPPGRSEYKKRR